MAMDIYVSVETDVIHKTKADFSKSISQRVIHLVQYDKKLPVIDVELFTNGEPYVIPGSAEVYVFWGNNDNTYVRTKCMTNIDRTHVYFKVEKEMCYLYGQVNPILELVVGDSRAGSSSFPVVIDRNPIQEYYVPAILPEGGIPLNALSKEGATTETYIGFDGTNIVWKEVSGGGEGSGGTVTSIQAGEGLSTAPDSSESGGTITTSGSLYLAKSGINEGTYTKVVVDKYGRVTAGYSLSDADIPDLPASKITSGILNVDRIPNLPANKITSGVFDIDRIPDLGYYTKPQNGIPLTDISLQGADTNYYIGFDGTNIVWKSVLPPYTSSDANKGLHVNSNGTGVEWKEDEPKAIIDVTELPSSNIRSDVLYRLNKYGKNIVKNVPCDNEQFSSMVFNHDLSIPEVEAIITRPEIWYNDGQWTLGGQTVKGYTYFITNGGDESSLESINHSFVIFKFPDLHNLMFIANSSLINYIITGETVGTPMVLWCNNGEVLSQITNGMFNVTGWNADIPSIINCWSFASKITAPTGLLCNNYLTDLVYISKHTQYNEVINIYEDGNNTTEACKRVKSLLMDFNDRIIYLDEIPSDPSVMIQNMVSGIYPYLQLGDDIICIMITKTPLKNNSNIYLGILSINNHQPLIDQASIVPIETYLGISSKITVDMKEIRQSYLYQYSDGMWKIVDDIFTYDIDLHLMLSIFFKYFLELMVGMPEMSIYEVPKNLLAAGYQDPTKFSLMILMIIFALISGPGAIKNNLHIDYSADIFDFNRLLGHFGRLLENYQNMSSNTLIVSSAAIIISVTLGLFSPGQNDELMADNIQAFGKNDISVYKDAFMDMNLFMPQFLYSLNLNGNNEYDNFYDLLEAKAKNKTFRLRVYLSNDILIRLACNVDSVSTSISSALNILSKKLGLMEPSILEYKFRGSSNDSKAIEYEITAAALLPNSMDDISTLGLDIKNFFKNKTSYKNILRFYRLDKILPDYPSLTGGFTVQSIFEFNFKAQKDYFTFDYADGKLSMRQDFVSNINSAIDAEFITNYALLTYFYKYKINYLSGPNTDGIQATQAKYSAYFNMKYDGKYLIQEPLYNPNTKKTLDNPGLLSPTPLQIGTDFTYDNTKAVVKYGYGEKNDSVTGFNHDQILVCADIFWADKWVLLSDYIITDDAGVSSEDKSQQGYINIGGGQILTDQIIYGLFLNYLIENPSSEYNTQYGIEIFRVRFSNLGIAKTSSKAINHEYNYIIYANSSTNLTNALNKFILAENFNNNPCLKNYTLITTENDGPYAGSIILKESIKIYTRDSTCISQDTMITMKDKTYKRAGDIKVGDIIMTANGPDKVIWIDSMCNKTCLNTKVYTFSDGTVLKVAYDHRVYSLNDKNYKKLSKWKLGEKTITDSGNIISLVKCELINEPITHCVIYTLKYNSQYANGLLTGNRLANIKNNFIRRIGAKLYYKLVLKKSNEKYGFKDNQ